jgi:hypothetical protein
MDFSRYDELRSIGVIPQTMDDLSLHRGSQLGRSRAAPGRRE